MVVGVCEKDRRDFNNIELIALKDPLVTRNEEKVSLMLSMFLMELIGKIVEKGIMKVEHFEHFYCTYDSS